MAFEPLAPRRHCRPQEHCLAVGLSGVLVFAAGIGAAACDNPSGASDGGPLPVAIDAFPAQVSPNGEALVVVTVNTTCSQTCTLCVGVPPVTGAGVVFIAGTGSAPESVVSVTSPPVGVPIHVTYRASAAAGDEIVSAYLFDGSGVACVPTGDAGASASAADLSNLLASASVEIIVESNTTSAPDSGESTDAGGENASTPADAAATDGAGGASDGSNGGG